MRGEETLRPIHVRDVVEDGNAARERFDGRWLQGHRRDHGGQPTRWGRQHTVFTDSGSRPIRGCARALVSVYSFASIRKRAVEGGETPWRSGERSATCSRWP